MVWTKAACVVYAQNGIRPHRGRVLYGGGDIGSNFAERDTDLRAEGTYSHYADHGDESDKQPVFGQGGTVLVATKAIDQLKNVNLHRLEHAKILKGETWVTGSTSLSGERLLPADESIDG
jgi:hypothetical protein